MPRSNDKPPSGSFRRAVFGYRISDWSGGTTIQIAIGPEDASYADRCFLWRLSSATVDLEESEFTALPDYLRFIAPIRGEMTLTHNGGAPVKLEPYEIHCFDGADATHSRGRCTDFNLMLRKGKCGGMITPLGGEEETILRAEPAADTVVIYCTEGSLAVSSGEERAELSPGEAALFRNEPIAPIRVTLSPDARAMCAQIWNIK